MASKTMTISFLPGKKELRQERTQAREDQQTDEFSRRESRGGKNQEATDVIF